MAEGWGLWRKGRDLKKGWCLWRSGKDLEEGWGLQRRERAFGAFFASCGVHWVSLGFL